MGFLGAFGDLAPGYPQGVPLQDPARLQMSGRAHHEQGGGFSVDCDRKRPVWDRALRRIRRTNGRWAGRGPAPTGDRDCLGGLGAEGLWFPSTSSGRAGRGRRPGLARMRVFPPSTGSGQAHHEWRVTWGVVGHGSFERLRTGLRRTPNRLTTNGVGPTIGSEGWVLGAVWFDTVRRVHRPGSPRTGAADGGGAACPVGSR